MMKYYSLFLICFSTIKFNNALQCTISKENGEQLSSDDANACYLIIEIDFHTKQRSIHYSDSTINRNKNTQHDYLQIDTLMTFDQQTDEYQNNNLIQSILIYTCTKPSFCNKQMTNGIIQIIDTVLQNDFLSRSSIETLHRLLVNSIDKTRMNPSIHCMTNTDDKFIECKSGLCFAAKSDQLNQSCFNVAVKENQTIQIKYKFNIMPTQSLEKIVSELSYTCNVDQCNSPKIVDQINDIFETNISFHKYRIRKRSSSSIGSGIEALKLALTEHLLHLASSESVNTTNTSTTTHNSTSISTTATSGTNNDHFNYSISILIFSAFIMAMQF